MDFFIHHQAIVETDKVGARTRIWGFSHIMQNVEIGEDCNIGEHCFIESSVKIGSRVVVKNGVSIWEGITIENDAFLGPHMVFTNDVNPRSGYPKPLAKTVVSKGATIGAGAIILAGVILGEYCLVGAGSVVTKSIKPHALVYGNPAKFKGWVCKCGLKLNIESEIRCACGKKYIVYNKGFLVEQ